MRILIRAAYRLCDLWGRRASVSGLYQRFIKSIQTGVNDQPDFTQGAKIQKVLDACFRSNQEGQTVAL